MTMKHHRKTSYHPVITNGDLDNGPSNDRYRFVEKNGHINVNYDTSERIKNMHSNIIIYIMETDWWLVLTLFLFGFIVSWFVFAFLYFLVSIEHGDFVISEEEENRTINTTGNPPQPQEMCVKDVHNFLSALLFSIETQHTIGYGSRYITTECMGGILVLTLQSSLGYLLQVIVAQIVFTKLSRPTEKSQYVVFSDNALILPRNNQLALTFRIGNISASQLIFASVRLLMIRRRKTTEGEIIPHQIYDMELTRLRNGQLFFPRPTIVEHIINSRSPLFGIQRAMLKDEHFEIIAIIEGAFDCTGFSCHFRTSYLPSELLWGYHFASCDSTLDGFDFQKFNFVELVDARPNWLYSQNDLNEQDTLETPVLAPCYCHVHYAMNNRKMSVRNATSDPSYINQLVDSPSPIPTKSNHRFTLIDKSMSADDAENVEEQQQQQAQKNLLLESSHLQFLSNEV